jgi:hypothetical protein
MPCTAAGLTRQRLRQVIAVAVTFVYSDTIQFHAALEPAGTCIESIIRLRSECRT